MKNRVLMLFSVVMAILFLSMLLLSCDQSLSNEGQQYGCIQGRVRYTNCNDHSGITLSLEKTGEVNSSGFSAIIEGIGTGSRDIITRFSTQKDGTFEFNNLTPGVYTVYASSDDSVEKEVSTNVVIKGSEMVTAEDLLLTATGTLTGYVLINGKTSGNNGYSVFLAGTSCMSSTDDTGFFSFSGVPAGINYQLIISKGNIISKDISLCSVTARGVASAGVKYIASSDFASDSQAGALVWKGCYTSADEIQNPNRNSVYFNTTDACSYVFNGTDWTLLSEGGTQIEQDPIIDEVSDVLGKISNNLVSGGDFESDSEADVLEDGSSIEYVMSQGIGGSKAIRVQQTETYGEVFVDLTKYYGRGKSYYVEASFKNDGSIKTSDLTARIDYFVVSGAVVDAVRTQWWEGYYDCDEIYTGEFMPDNEAMKFIAAESYSVERPLSDDGFVTLRGIIPATEIERVLEQTTDLYGYGSPTIYNLFAVFYVGSFNDQDGYSYYLDNVVIKDLNSELPRQGRTYVPSDETEDPDAPVLKWYRVKFDVQGGSYLAPISVCEGTSVSIPATPTKEGFDFAGWYKDSTYLQEFDPNSSVYSNLTLYAKWTKKTVIPIIPPVEDGYEVYRLTATHGVAEDLYSYDKFIVEFRDALVHPGDVLSFKFRSNIEFTYFSLRGDSKWIYESRPYQYDYPRFFSSFDKLDDGWTYVTYIFPEEDAPTSKPVYYEGGTWFRIDFGSRTGDEGIKIGDILEIKDISLNDEPLIITAESVTSGVQPTFEIVNSSEWRTHIISFDTLSGSDVDPILVEFGRKPDMPADPKKNGVLFDGWYMDSAYTVPFDPEKLLTSDIVLYARWNPPRTVTFNSKGGSAVASITVPKGWTVDEPEAPERNGYKFAGWYTDSSCLNAFDFTSAITQSITLYAKWVQSNILTLNLNYEGASDERINVGRGLAIEEPPIPIRTGFYFGGWFEDAECTIAFDFASGIVENTTIYAKWTEPTHIYRFTATTDNERFQFRWKATTVPEVESFKAGDVLSFKVRFMSASGAIPSYYRLRSYSNETNIARNIPFESCDVDGWIPVTIVFPGDVDYSGNGLLLGLYANGQFRIGDIVEIKGLSFNGVELPITGSSSSGPYSGCYPTIEIIDID